MMHIFIAAAIFIVAYAVIAYISIRNAK
jgi:hypothetical protein